MKLFSKSNLDRTQQNRFLNRHFALKKVCILGGLLMMTSCTVLEAQSNAGASSAPATSRASTQTNSNANSNQTAIPVINTAANDDQQALINEINRDGNPQQFTGYRDQVPAPEQLNGNNVVELNYEQADLRLVLEELADALDISIVIDPSIDDKISIRT